MTAPVQTDGVKWKAHAKVSKFTAEQERIALEVAAREGIPIHEALLRDHTPYEVTEEEGNLLTRLGLHRMWDRFIGTASNQALDATHTRIGVGDGVTAAATTDTDLSAAAGSTHRWFQLVGSVATIGAGASSGVLTVVATFATGDGNFAWNEFGIDIGTATVTSSNTVNAVLLNHKTSIAAGTKASGAVWTATATITLA